MSADPWAAQQPAQNTPAQPFGGQPATGQQPTWTQPAQSAQSGAAAQPPSLNDALAGGAKSAFDQNTPVNIVVQGEITGTEVRQMRFNGQPKFWDDGNPQWQIVVQIENGRWSDGTTPMAPLRADANDRGDRAIYIKTWGPNFAALQAAIKETGQTEAEKALVKGATFSAKHTARQRSSAGGNDELLFAYHIAPGSGAAGGAAPPPQAAQQPAAQPQAGGVTEEPPF